MITNSVKKKNQCFQKHFRLPRKRLWRVIRAPPVLRVRIARGRKRGKLYALI